MQKRKLAPFPFFSQTKKPRRAFYANPNDVFETENVQGHHLYPSRTGTEPSHPSFQSQSARFQTLPSSARNFPSFSYQQKNLKHSTLQKYQNQYPYNHGRESRLNCPDVTALNSQYQPDPMSHMQYKPLREKNGSFALQSTAVISETSTSKPRPTKGASLHSRIQTRVITTSSQGVQYWSEYKNYLHLLFELFGFLDSQVSPGEFGCQQFMIKTIDGVIRCHFWEMDYRLPSLFRGKSYRVIGTWDAESRILKCVKVRESTPEEMRHYDQFIKLSDKAMREFTCSLNEP